MISLKDADDWTNIAIVSGISVENIILLANKVDMEEKVVSFATIDAYCAVGGACEWFSTVGHRYTAR